MFKVRTNVSQNYKEHPLRAEVCPQMNYQGSIQQKRMFWFYTMNIVALAVLQYWMVK